MDPNLFSNNLQQINQQGNQQNIVNIGAPLPPQNPYAPQSTSFIPISHSEPPQNSKGKKLALLFFIFLAIIAVPLTVYLAKQRQTIQNEAATALSPNTIVAIVNGNKITNKDLKDIALESYGEQYIDQQALKDSLDIAIERQILDIHKIQKKINVPQEEINLKIQADGFSAKQAYYEVLKEKITTLEAKYWKIYSIGFWIPPTDQRSGLSTEEVQITNTRYSEGLSALDEITRDMATQKSALDIAKEIIVKYPSLKDVMGVNGYTLKTAEDREDIKELQNPETYSFVEANKGQPFFDGIYSLRNVGEIKKILGANQSGGYVIKLVEFNTGAAFDTYAEWFNSKKQSMVTITYNL